MVDNNQRDMIKYTPLDFIILRITKNVTLPLALLFSLFSISLLAQDLQENKPEIFEKIKSETPQRGVYLLYSEFLANSPSITDSFYVRESPRTQAVWQGTVSVQPRYVEKNKKVKKVWGFSDGKQAYIFNELEFFPIEIEENDMVFYGYDRVDNSGSTTAAIIGGAIGGGIAASAALSKAKSQRIRYTIHPVIGTGLHPDGSLNQQIETQNELVIYRRSRKESELPAQFVVNGDQLYSFDQKSYVFLKYPVSTTTVQICSGNGFEECISVSLNPEETSYVECTFLENASSSKVILQDESQGEFDFFKIENAQDKRGKQEPEIIKK